MAKRQETANDGRIELRLSLPVSPLSAKQEAGYDGERVARGDVELRTRIGTHINAQLGQRAARALVALRDGLRRDHAALDNGRPVHTSTDALRWLLESVSAEMEAG